MSVDLRMLLPHGERRERELCEELRAHAVDPVPTLEKMAAKARALAAKAEERRERQDCDKWWRKVDRDLRRMSPGKASTRRRGRPPAGLEPNFRNAYVLSFYVALSAARKGPDRKAEWIAAVQLSFLRRKAPWEGWDDHGFGENLVLAWSGSFLRELVGIARRDSRSAWILMQEADFVVPESKSTTSASGFQELRDAQKKLREFTKRREKEK